MLSPGVCTAAGAQWPLTARTAVAATGKCADILYHSNLPLPSLSCLDIHAEPGGSKRFKSLSVLVPETVSQPILRRMSAGGDMPASAAASVPPAAVLPGMCSLEGPTTSQDLLLREHSASISGGEFVADGVGH